jgi:hypothetical protein
MPVKDRVTGLRESLPTATLHLWLLRHREVPFDNLKERELIARCELPQNLMSVSGEPDGSVPARISPRRPDPRVQLFPLLCVKKPVTPALFLVARAPAA